METLIAIGIVLVRSILILIGLYLAARVLAWGITLSIIQAKKFAAKQQEKGK